jgi:hypothetical protein
MTVTLFEPRRPREPKGRGGKSIVGIWATQDEQAMVKALSAARGHATVADYFRALIRDDIDRNGAPDGHT